MAMKTHKIPKRDQVALEDTWDLTKVFKSDAAWQRAYKKLEKMVDGFDQFRGKLGKSARTIRRCCDFEAEFGQIAEKVAVYAFLKASQDVANSTYQGMVAQFTYLATQANERASFISPEIQAIPKKKMADFMKNPALKPYQFKLEQLLRYRPHILSDAEERILAMQGQVSGTASRVFSQLNDADLDFGEVKNDEGENVELSQSSIRSLLESRMRTVRKTAFEQFYKEYEAHANTLAAALSGSVLQDVYSARVRNHTSAREAALFGDKVPVGVYDNLIEQVHSNLDVYQEYLRIRKRALKLKELQPYDGAVELFKLPKVDIPYEDAVETICDALRPLGRDYVNTLHKGLTEKRWVDRYENKGKRSGQLGLLWHTAVHSDELQV
jgi:oligoendopeptidase F